MFYSEYSGKSVGKLMCFLYELTSKSDHWCISDGSWYKDFSCTVKICDYEWLEPNKDNYYLFVPKFTFTEDFNYLQKVFDENFNKYLNTLCKIKMKWENMEYCNEQKTNFLETIGMSIVRRDENMNTDFDYFNHRFQISEHYEDGYTQKNGGDNNEVWCIVGNNKEELINDAFDMFFDEKDHGVLDNVY